MTDWTIIFDPTAPIWLIWLLAVAAAGLALIGLTARARGALWRALASAALLALLLNPQLRQAERRALPDILALVVDRSDSNRLDRRAERTQRALEALEARVEALDGVEARVIEADNAPDGTRLFEALARGLTDVPRARLGGVVLLTDGQSADGAEIFETIGVEAPVHALLTGSQREGDRKLTIVNAPRFGIVGEEIAIRLRIDDFGAVGSADATAEAVVRIDGQEAARGRVPIGVERTLRATVSHGGANVIEVEAAAAPNELTLANNAATMAINGVRDRLRVLLVSGEPHSGERAWRNLLKSDPAVDLVHFTILRPPNKQDGTPTEELALIAFPTRELFQEKLDEFDLIIFDRYRLRGVLPPQYFHNIEGFVRGGGAVLVAAGPAFGEPFYSLARTPLANFLPAFPTGAALEQAFRPKVTGDGLRHPVTAGLPLSNASAGEAPHWGRWMRLIEARALGGEVLMSGPADKPLLVLDHYGEGRAAILLSDQAWLWSRGYDGGGPQAELFRRLAHWLMKEPDLEEEDLRAATADNQLIVSRRTMAPEPPETIVTTPSGETIEASLAPVSPGLWRGALDVEQTGLYRVASGDLFAVAALGAAFNPELQDVIATDALIGPTAHATGGGVVALDDDGALRLPRLRRTRSANAAFAPAPGSGWIGVLRREQYALDDVVERPLAPPLVWLGALAALLAVAWLRESR